jgi:flagellar biosynthesis/type III secretory pathway protein FliH
MSTRLFIVSVTAFAVFALPAVAAAQAPTWQRAADGARYGYRTEARVAYVEARRIAYDHGYREGLARGQADARRGQRYGYQNVRDFQRADKGYHRSYGDRERYRQIFRDGYAAGYSEGYARVARTTRGAARQGPYYPSGRPGVWGPSGQYGAYYSPAFDNGMRDGYEKGLEDARRNRSFDPVRHSWYRAGDRHYQSRYGSRDQYKDVYRRGFQQGYERGYGEGRYGYRR